MIGLGFRVRSCLGYGIGLEHEIGLGYGIGTGGPSIGNGMGYVCVRT